MKKKALTVFKTQISETCLAVAKSVNLVLVHAAQAAAAVVAVAAVQAPVAAALLHLHPRLRPPLALTTLLTAKRGSLCAPSPRSEFEDWASAKRKWKFSPRHM